ncbi:hypothetical protein [Bdellovibrio sp. HCB2-146]|uniref:hypothetical protein n=1 Tax=Bdellovibrio sp. HCB2-146 TaxID=3394362 RepID=UPI0039BCBFEE
MLDKGEDILKVIDFVETIHHPKEEQLLFPVIAKQVWLSQGGPLCTYYRGLQLEFDPLAPVRRYLRLFYEQSGISAPSIGEYSWLSEQSPLSIPMEEHFIGHELSVALRFLSNKKNSALYAEFFEIFRKLYSDLLRVHISKEDNCLFVMCEAKMS